MLLFAVIVLICMVLRPDHIEGARIRRLIRTIHRGKNSTTHETFLSIQPPVPHADALLL
jgi:hypothetical protein